jgi:hypothetical protein
VRAWLAFGRLLGWLVLWARRVGGPVRRCWMYGHADYGLFIFRLGDQRYRRGVYVKCTRCGENVWQRELRQDELDNLSPRAPE